jgi:hypothetical protein
MRNKFASKENTNGGAQLDGVCAAAGCMERAPTLVCDRCADWDNALYCGEACMLAHRDAHSHLCKLAPGYSR